MVNTFKGIVVGVLIFILVLTLATTVSRKVIAASAGNCRLKNTAKRGNLNLKRHGNPVASLKSIFRKALETIHGVPLGGNEMVQALQK